MKLKLDVNKNIFREYDIRGVYPLDIDEDVAYTIGKAYGSYIRERGFNKCVVGHDNRISSDSLYDALINGILECGVDIIGLGLVTTPMYYYGCIKLGIDQGIMVTASHNPKDDNGFKFAFSDSGNAKGAEITDFYNYLVKGEFVEGIGTYSAYNIEQEYLELMKNSISIGSRPIKVLVDCGNGTTSIIAKKIFDMFPMNVNYIFSESDGTFPNHHPDPAVESNLTVLKEKVVELGCDVGLAFDGDGDRLGVISNTGRYIPADLYMIIIIRDLINKVSKKEFLYDVKCTKALTDEIEKLGGHGIIYRTGNSYTKAAVKNYDLMFGGELSGHVYFRDKFLGFDSGIYAGLRLCEILSNTDKSVEDLLYGIEKYYSTEEIKVKTTDDKKFDIVNSVKEYCDSKNYQYITVDGIRVEFDDSWALVRASNTGPNLTVRFEAKTKERLEQIQNEFGEVINNNL